jgi:hypothetical protein
MECPVARKNYEEFVREKEEGGSGKLKIKRRRKTIKKKADEGQVIITPTKRSRTSQDEDEEFAPPIKRFRTKQDVDEVEFTPPMTRSRATQDEKNEEVNYSSASTSSTNDRSSKSEYSQDEDEEKLAPPILSCSRSIQDEDSEEEEFNPPIPSKRSRSIPDEDSEEEEFNPPIPSKRSRTIPDEVEFITTSTFTSSFKDKSTNSKYLESLLSDRQINLFLTNFGCSSNKEVVIAFSFSNDSKTKIPRWDSLIPFLNDLTITIKQEIDDISLYDNVVNLILKHDIRLSLWRLFPSACDSQNHQYCRLQKCGKACFRSCIGNGQCGYQLDCLLSKRATLDISERDFNDKEEIRIINFLEYSEFIKFMRKRLQKLPYQSDIYGIYWEAYTWAAQFKDWKSFEKDFYFNDSPKKWCTNEILNQLYNYGKSDYQFAVFSTTDGANRDLPYINGNDSYLFCDFHTYSSRISPDYNTAIKIFSNPNHSGLLDDHYFLLSSGNNLITDFNESMKDLILICKNIVSGNFEAVQTKQQTFKRFGRDYNSNSNMETFYTYPPSSSCCSSSSSSYNGNSNNNNNNDNNTAKLVKKSMTETCKDKKSHKKSKKKGGKKSYSIISKYFDVEAEDEGKELDEMGEEFYDEEDSGDEGFLDNSEGSSDEGEELEQVRAASGDILR